MFKEKLPEVSREANSFFDSMESRKVNLTSVGLQQMIDDKIFDDFVKGNKLADESLISFLKDTKYATKDLESYK